MKLRTVFELIKNISKLTSLDNKNQHFDISIPAVDCDNCAPPAASPEVLSLFVIRQTCEKS
jgi:hypothetical protein